MENSWLVQRLQAPYAGMLAGKDNPFSFGGGLRNGGLSKEAMGLLRGIFTFDYMGTSEFEWGVVPKALNKVAKNVGTYRTFAFQIPLADVAKHWRDKTTYRPEGFATVYVICDSAASEEVEQRIRAWASESVDRLKEPTMLSYALRPMDDFDRRHCGWLELDNGFFFFTDKTMWQATATLFGIEVGTS